MEREVLLLSTGGTIAMRGGLAVPADGPDALLSGAGASGVRSKALFELPGAHVGTAEALRIAREAVAAAAAGAGVVVAHGTDTLEETAFLTDLLHGDGPPIAFTGAIRPASAPGADGPANLLDAIAVARAPHAAGIGAVVVFAGEVHAARAARKLDSSAPAAFGSPATGPIGRVVEGRLSLRARPQRPAPLPLPEALAARVPIVTAALGEDLALLEAAVLGGADGAVVVALGGGHLSPPALALLRAAAAAVPVALAVRPERGALLDGTYGFEGAEGDLRATGAIPAGALSPQAARIKLLACLGAGLHGEALAAAFADDAF